MIRHNRHKAIPGETITTPKLTSMLMESATGSGKTHTVFTTIEELRHTKNRHNSINEKGVFPNFNILVLTDRIGLGDQLRKKAVDGDVHEEDKTIELPILSDELIDHFHVKTYHSKVDYALGKYNNIHDVEVIEDGEKSIEAKEYMHFCTFQTAKNEIAREQIAIPNIIIIDEADIVTMGSDYLETLMSYYIPDEH